MKRLTDLGAGLQVIHQTGQADFAAIKEVYNSLPFEAEVLPFIEKMDEAYARADLVLCRAGATTVAELTAFGKPAVLVPYPYAIYDHQRWNAQALQDQGAAEMILDQELDGDLLAERIRDGRNPRRESPMSAMRLSGDNRQAVKFYAAEKAPSPLRWHRRHRHERCRRSAIESGLCGYRLRSA
jgi:UDP-N-acetylglucosamine--N-acetylmuramyl-(pentapeptide) pyrophosphoryl-undecaprenol N-acetylglucosamine transferase